MTDNIMKTFENEAIKLVASANKMSRKHVMNNAKLRENVYLIATDMFIGALKAGVIEMPEADKQRLFKDLEALGYGVQEAVN